jgi:hypothetical protein
MRFTLRRPRRRPLLGLTAVLAALGAIAPAAFGAAAIAPPYNSDYSIATIGPPPGVPTNLGGLTVLAGTTNKLLIGGHANAGDSALYEIGVTRDVNGHINGFSGSATQYSPSPFIDGGLAYGPGGVLFFAGWPANHVGEIKPGSSSVDKDIDMGALGEAGSVAALNFVPAGLPEAGHLKLVSYSGGQWYDSTVTPDGSGTYNITGLTNIPGSTMPGGPEGFIYVPTGSPQFPNETLMLSEYQAGKVQVFSVDSNSDPVPASAKDFITGLTNVEGANTDPVTGDFLFSSFGSDNSVYVVRGFAAPTATMMLDSHKAPSTGATTADTGSYLLANGQQYTVTVKGTYRAYSNALMSGTQSGWKVCGTPEPSPQFPSPTITNGPVGQDALFVFAKPQANQCDKKVKYPYAYPAAQRVLKFDTGGGSGYQAVTPDGGVPSTMPADHTYTYTVTGTGHALKAELVDANTADNAGQFQITVGPATSPPTT